MFLFEVALIILSIAIIVSLSLKFFWVASFIILYRAISSVLTFEYISEKFGIEGHTLYFILLLFFFVSFLSLLFWASKKTFLLESFLFFFLLLGFFYIFVFEKIF